MEYDNKKNRELEAAANTAAWSLAAHARATARAARDKLKQDEMIALAMMTPEQRTKYNEMVAEQKMLQIEYNKKALRLFLKIGIGCIALIIIASVFSHLT